GPRPGRVLRHGQGDGRSEGHQLERPQERLRPRLPLPWTDRDAAQNRAGQEQRGPGHRLFLESAFLGVRDMSPLLKTFRLLMIGAVAMVLANAVVSTQSPRFFSDDPIAKEPDPEDASRAQPTDIGLVYDLGYNLLVTAGRTPTNKRARNINTIDEVPDSSWFTNRIGSRPLTVDDIVRGPLVGPPPAPDKWVIIREKSSGYAPGFTARDANGETWFVSFDPPSNPKGATGAMVIANKLFWALGYNQVETFLTKIDPRRVEIAHKAPARSPTGSRTPFTQSDLNAVLERAARNTDGTYEAAAARLLPGKTLGPFRYDATRPARPDDIV